MKIKSIVFFCLAVYSVTIAGVTILENSKDRLKISWDIGNVDTALVQDNGEKAYALSFNGNNIFLGESGDPVLPGMAFFAGVPLSGNVRVSVTPLEQKSLRLSFHLKKRKTRIGKIRLKSAEVACYIHILIYLYSGMDVLLFTCL